MVTRHAIVDQRQVIYTAYELQKEDHDRYQIFKTRDIIDRLCAPRGNVAGVIHKATEAGLIKMVGKKGTIGLYTLTQDGLKRGAWYMEHYNIITGEIS